MKKLVSIVLTLILAVGMLTGFALAEEPKTYAFVSKQAGNNFHEVVASGFEEACEAIGAECIIQHPEDTSAEMQIGVINNLIAQGVDGIAIAANDAEALESTLENAKAQGIHIVTVDSDTKGSEVFVNQCDSEALGKIFVDSVYELCEGEGQFAILSATSTATNQNAWIAAMEAYMASDSKFDSLELVATVYGDDELQKSYDETTSLLTNYPDLKCISAPTCIALQAAVQAVQAAGSSVKCHGLGMPSWMDGLLGENCPYFHLWNVPQMGSTAAYVLDALVTGETTGAVGEEFTTKNDTTYTVIESAEDLGIYSTQIIMGDPMLFDETNIDEWKVIF